MSARRPPHAPDVARARPRAPAVAVGLVAVFALKLAVLLQFQKYPLLQADAGPESIVYVELARQVVGGNLALGPGLYVVSPLYVYFLALILRLTDSFFWVRIVQIALATAGVALVFRTADTWHGRRAAWYAGVLATFTGVFTFHEVLLLPSALDPFLTALALYLLVSALRAPEDGHRAVPGALAGLALGVLGLNRPMVLLAAAGLVSLLLISRRARRWRTALLLTAGIVMAVAPLLARNYKVAADLAPVSSHGGLSFFIGNNPDADGTHRTADGIAPSIVAQRDDARQVAERAIGRTLDDSEVSAHFYGLGWKWILGQPAAAARLFVRKLAYVFNAAPASLSYSYAYYVRDEHNVLRYLPVGAWLLVPLGLLGLWLGAPLEPERRRAFWLWASFIAFYAVAIAVFYVSSRLTLPLLVPLCVTAGAALDGLAARAEPVKNDHRTPYPQGFEGRAYAVIVLLAILAIFANWRFGLNDGRTEERTRMALWLIGQERYDEAESRVAEIERGHARPGVLHFRIGRAFLVREQADAAVRHLDRARALDPDRPEIAFALGQALLAGRRPKEAIPHLRRALEAVNAGVRPDIAGFDLARAHAAAGDRAGAVKVLQTVRPARVDDGESWRALGQLALELQTPRLAEAFLRQAVRVEPKSVDGLEQLGLAIALSGRFEEAVGPFEEAVRLDGRDASARLNLAVALAEVGRVAEARRQAEEALRLDPSYDKARQFLGAISEKPKSRPAR